MSFADASGLSICAGDGVIDLEMGENTFKGNTTVQTLSWSNVNVLVKDRVTKAPVSILSSASGLVQFGEMLAIMGPSGSGKTTLLNALAHRVAAAGATTSGDFRVNGQTLTRRALRQLSAYVEQEDALIGSLTVRETMMFSARLSLPRNVSRKEAIRRVDALMASFGLHTQADTVVGTPMNKGLSGGQKKRLSVASRLVTNPNILFLDEPTSGLDSALSLEVCSYIRNVCKTNNLLVIASIHQPSSAAFHQFDKLCLLSGGHTCYFGHVADATDYFSALGYPVSAGSSSAEHFLDLINTDLDRDGEIHARNTKLVQAWTRDKNDSAPKMEILSVQRGGGGRQKKRTASILSVQLPAIGLLKLDEADRPSTLRVSAVLLHRSWIKARRDIMAYGIRLAMYLGLAIMMGTVFLRFRTEQKYIVPYTNAIFFAGAFISFMAVAYVPAYLEDLSTFKQERANGLVTPLAFLLPNFLIGLPFLFAIALLFSILVYWLSGFAPSADAFFRWVLWLFLDLVAAEGLVVLLSTLFPVFVIALAVTAFANGLWMCVDGFLAPMAVLNPFWKYVFHYIDYQTYVFQGMMVNEFRRREYRCAEAAAATVVNSSNWHCSYPSDLNGVGRIRGTDILAQFSISTGYEGIWVGILIGIIAGYRLIAYLVLVLKK